MLTLRSEKQNQFIYQRLEPEITQQYKDVLSARDNSEYFKHEIEIIISCDTQSKSG